MFSNSGKFIIVSGPSGVGKTTFIQHLLKTNVNYRFSVSACTRAKRPQEIHGKDYHFLSVSEFKRKIEQDEFIEWQEVYEGSYYGTLKKETEKLLKAGEIVIFDVKVQGGLQLKSYLKDRALAIYIKAPSMELLEERLRNRKTDSQESIALRMEKVELENKLATQFDVVLINNHLQTFLQEAQKILDEFLAN